MSARSVYRARCKTAWDGDEAGNEWTCGASVYASDENPGTFDVYEDDGRGNGDGLAFGFPSLFDAKQYADLYCKFADAGGYGDSPEFAQMCRLAQAVAS